MTHTSSDTRTLRALELPSGEHQHGGATIRRGLYVDCETTGKDWARDEVIEVALLPFTYTLDRHVVEVETDDAQSYRRDPGRALCAEITALTGLTDDNLRGQHIDVAAAEALIARADLLVAHNARFDRPFFERVLPASRAKPWGCSRLEVPWLAAGCPSDRACTACCAFTGCTRASGTGAMADCEAGVWLLAQRLPGTGRPVLGILRERVMAESLRLWAVGAPFGTKDELRARGLSVDARAEGGHRPLVVDGPRPRDARARVRVA